MLRLKVEEDKKKTNLLIKLIEFAATNSVNVTLFGFVIKNPIDIYKYDKNIF